MAQELQTAVEEVAADTLLSELLGTCPKLKLLVTSRALLRVWGENAFTLAPLEMPNMQDPLESEALSNVASVALFVQRIQAVLPEFQLTDENARVIAEICMRMEGVPLAIELAAAQGKLLPLKALLSRLEHPLEVLTRGRRDAPGHQRSLRNSVGWNYDLLSSDEQTLFRRLAVFVKGCSLQALEAQSIALGGMALSALDGVLALVDKSLLRCSAYGENELCLYPFEMIRAYSLELLTQCGELERTQKAHAATLCA